jgi:hypothetical protein
MSVAKKRFSGPAQLSNAAATKYTVPSTTLSVLKHIHVSNTSAGAVNFTLSIGADAASTRIFDAYTIASGAILDLWVYFVLSAAEIIQAFGSVNNQLTLTLDGDEITLG